MTGYGERKNKERKTPCSEDPATQKDTKKKKQATCNLCILGLPSHKTLLKVIVEYLINV